MRLRGRPIIDVVAGRAQIAPPASEDRFGQIRVQEVVVRDTASTKTVGPQVQVVGRKKTLLPLERKRAGRRCASKVDKVHGSHSNAKVEEEAVDHRVVNGDGLLPSVSRATYCPRKDDHARAAGERPLKPA